MPFFYGREQSKEYIQKVISANQEVLYALRPTISSGDTPSHLVIAAVVRATSVKYGIPARDMASPSRVIDTLIKEVMETHFINSKTKEEYCEKLMGIRRAPVVRMQSPLASGGDLQTSESPVPEKTEMNVIFRRQRAEQISRFSTLLGLMAGVMSAAMTVLISSRGGVFFDRLGNQLSFIFGEKLQIILIPLLATTIIIAVMTIFILIEYSRKKNSIRLYPPKDYK